MKRLFLLGVAVCMSWILTLGAMADINCRGRVIDEQGEPLIGAYVIIPNTSKGVSTDLEGYFQIKVPNGTKVIKISYVGYLSNELAPKAEMGNIVLKTETKMLQDVV